VMLNSEACLIVSRTADWTQDRRAALDQVLARIGVSSGL
jgi:ATP phosphoribosyltransferase